MKKAPDVTVVDYGMGNLNSVSKAVEKLGYKALVSSQPQDVKAAVRLIVPGVGAFAKAMSELRKRRLIAPLKAYLKSGRPFLGICLGYQILFDESEEGGRPKGLGVFSGKVPRFRKAAKIPHMGWNQVHFAARQARRCPLLKKMADGTDFYFVHSYYPVPKDRSLACLKTRYGETFASMIWKDNIFASQFHPEKSQADGLAILDAFLKLNGGR